MASRKLLALAFIKQYIEQWARSPSYREIGTGAGVEKDAARRIVRQLTKDGAIVRTKGARRGIALPDQVDEALALLTACEWTIDSAARTLGRATKTTLTLVAELDHVPDDEIGGDEHDRGSGAGKGDARDH